MVAFFFGVFTLHYNSILLVSISIGIMYWTAINAESTNNYLKRLSQSGHSDDKGDDE